MVEHFSLDGVPGKYFKCPNLGATLAVERCKTMYQTAKTAKIDLWLRMEKCRGCAVGADHCGEKPIVKNDFTLGKMICVRCHESASRLLRCGVCISCFNRQREVERGCNGKGGKPKPFEIFWQEPEIRKNAGKCKTVVIHDVQVSVVGRGAVITRASTTLEAALVTLRRDPGAVFRRGCRSSVVATEPSLFGGVACRSRHKKPQRRTLMQVPQVSHQMSLVW